MHKAGTVKEISVLKEILPKGIYQSALGIATMLDKQYGAERDVDKNDGGFILIAESVQDVIFINEKYLCGNAPENVDLVTEGRKRYINAFFLCNNEFGINVFIPIEFTPREFLRDLPEKQKIKRQHNLI